jgi:hypothetical protein
VHAYPIEALPSGYAYWLPTLTVSVVASLAALTAATYATAGSIRGTQTEATSDIDTLMDLDTITG